MYVYIYIYACVYIYIYTIIYMYLRVCVCVCVSVCDFSYHETMSSMNVRTHAHTFEMYALTLHSALETGASMLLYRLA